MIQKRRMWCVRRCSTSKRCKQKYFCEQCGGGGICIHKKRKNRCAQCKGSGICIHGKEKRLCTLCRVSGKGLGGRCGGVLAVFAHAAAPALFTEVLLLAVYAKTAVPAFMTAACCNVMLRCLQIRLGPQAIHKRPPSKIDVLKPSNEVRPHTLQCG